MGLSNLGAVFPAYPQPSFKEACRSQEKVTRSSCSLYPHFIFYIFLSLIFTYILKGTSTKPKAEEVEEEAEEPKKVELIGKLPPFKTLNCACFI